MEHVLESCYHISRYRDDGKVRQYPPLCAFVDRDIIRIQVTGTGYTIKMGLYLILPMGECL